MQTAIRQVENLSIKMGRYAFHNVDVADKVTDANICKWYCYVYIPNIGLCGCQPDSKKKKYFKTQWVDIQFHNQLLEFCELLYESNCITGNLKLFAQHNCGNYILQADPNYTLNKPWYDWAEILWNKGRIPAKLLLFMDIEEQIGRAHV